MNLVDIALVKDKYWRNLAKSKGCGMYSDDIVNEFYIKLMNIKNKNDVNIDAYLTITFCNMIMDFQRKKKKITFVEIDKLNLTDECNIERLKDFEEILKESIKISNSISPFDGALFEHYVVSGKSYDKIAKGCDISKNTIRHSIKNSKDIIKSKLQMKWQNSMM